MSRGQYHNYNEYIQHKNCCKPIGEKGPRGPMGIQGSTGERGLMGVQGQQGPAGSGVRGTGPNSSLQFIDPVLPPNLKGTSNLLFDTTTTPNKLTAITNSEFTGETIIDGAGNKIELKTNTSNLTVNTSEISTTAGGSSSSIKSNTVSFATTDANLSILSTGISLETQNNNDIVLNPNQAKIRIGGSIIPDKNDHYVIGANPSSALHLVVTGRVSSGGTVINNVAQDDLVLNAKKIMPRYGFDSAGNGQDIGERSNTGGIGVGGFRNIYGREYYAGSDSVGNGSYTAYSSSGSTGILSGIGPDLNLSNTTTKKSILLQSNSTVLSGATNPAFIINDASGIKATSMLLYGSSTYTNSNRDKLLNIGYDNSLINSPINNTSGYQLQFSLGKSPSYGYLDVVGSIRILQGQDQTVEICGPGGTIKAGPPSAGIGVGWRSIIDGSASTIKLGSDLSSLSNTNIQMNGIDSTIKLGPNTSSDNYIELNGTTGTVTADKIVAASTRSTPIAGILEVKDALGNKKLAVDAGSTTYTTRINSTGAPSIFMGSTIQNGPASIKIGTITASGAGMIELTASSTIGSGYVNLSVPLEVWQASTSTLISAAPSGLSDKSIGYSTSNDKLIYKDSTGTINTISNGVTSNSTFIAGGSFDTLCGGVKAGASPSYILIGEVKNNNGDSFSNICAMGPLTFPKIGLGTNPSGSYSTDKQYLKITSQFFTTPSNQFGGLYLWARYILYRPNSAPSGNLPEPKEPGNSSNNISLDVSSGNTPNLSSNEQWYVLQPGALKYSWGSSSDPKPQGAGACVENFKGYRLQRTDSGRAFTFVQYCTAPINMTTGAGTTQFPELLDGWYLILQVRDNYSTGTRSWVLPQGATMSFTSLGGISSTTAYGGPVNMSIEVINADLPAGNIQTNVSVA